MTDTAKFLRPVLHGEKVRMRGNYDFLSRTATHGEFAVLCVDIADRKS
jgi:hypothetical protein